MLSKFFWGVLGFGVLVWFYTKSIKIALLPLIIYIFVRLSINLMLLFENDGNRP